MWLITNIIFILLFYFNLIEVRNTGKQFNVATSLLLRSPIDMWHKLSRGDSLTVLNDVCIRILSLILILFCPTGHLREGVQERLWGRRHLVRAPPDRRHGRSSPQVVRWICLGLQELRRWRPVGYCCSGIWIARSHDLRSGEKYYSGGLIISACSASWS